MTSFDDLEREFQNRQQPTYEGVMGGVPARIPFKEKFTSFFGLGPIAPLQIAKAEAVVAESNRIPYHNPDGKLTHAEAVVLSGPQKRAMNALEVQVKGPIEKKIASIKDLFAKINLIDQKLERIGEVRLIGPNGEQLTPSEAQDAHDTLRDQVVRETNDGSKKHQIRREGRGARAKELMLLAIDLPIFTYAMFSLLNVNIRLVLAGDGDALVGLLVAVIFGLLGTILFGTIMRSMGKRHRRFKGADSSIAADSKTALMRLRIEQVVALCIVGAVAFVMGARVYSEGVAAEAEPMLILPLSIMLALLVGVSGYINYQGEYENGSDEIDRVVHLSRQLSDNTSYVESLHHQRALLLEAAGMACATLARMILEAKEHAVKTVATSTPYKTIAIARSYAGATTPVLVPKINSEVLQRVEKQAADLASHHETLARTNKEG